MKILPLEIQGQSSDLECGLISIQQDYVPCTYVKKKMDDFLRKFFFWGVMLDVELGGMT